MRMLAILSSLVLSLSVSVAATEQQRFITHYISPFTYEENAEIKGFAVDVVTKMMKMLKHPVSFDMQPFQRGLYNVQNSQNTALFIVARRPERETTMKWVGPLISSGIYVYTHKSAPDNLKTFDDLRKLQYIGVGQGNADHTYLMSKGFTNLFPNKDQKASLQMLVSRRIDATIMSEIVMPEMAKNAGINLSDLKRSDVKLYDSVLYLGFSLDVSDEEVQKWQIALDVLKESGYYETLYRHYVHEVK